MVQKLTDEEIARVFAMYCPSREKIFINPQTGITYYGTLYQLSSMRGFLHEYKLIAIPLSKVTDECASDIIKIVYPYYEGRRDDIKFALSIIEEMNADLGLGSMRWSACYGIIQYLKLKGYAVPLWFDINHWANGRTAIELGIAIEKTT